MVCYRSINANSCTLCIPCNDCNAIWQDLASILSHILSCRITQRPQAGETLPLRSAEKQQASTSERHALDSEEEVIAAVTINAAAA